MNAPAGILGVILFVVAITIAITWIVFPFTVINKFNELLKIERQRAKEERESLAQLHRDNHEIAKSLQWFVDNWPGTDNLDYDRVKERAAFVDEVSEIR